MSPSRPANSPNRVAITIGNFDGVHRGHAALIAAARRAADWWHGSPSREGLTASPSRSFDGDDASAGSESRRDDHGSESRATVRHATQVVALCFDPNPLTVLRPDAVPPQLSSFEQRRQWLMQAGADVVEPLRPTKEFLAQTPEAFIKWLVETYRPIAIVEGPDFRFGRGRAGSIETLRKLGEAHGFETIVVDPVEVALTDQSMVRASSSMVRWLVAHGRVRDARLVVGRPFELRGAVVRGDQRGRSIGIPTANLTMPGFLLPADGIYAGSASAPDGSLHSAAISVGTKPTFGESPRTCEAHLLDYNGPLDEYDWTMRVEFHEWLRDQLVYEDVELLMEQIRRDVARTRVA